jgi:hypothetical protein
LREKFVNRIDYHATVLKYPRCTLYEKYCTGYHPRDRSAAKKYQHNSAGTVIQEALERRTLDIFHHNSAL